MKNIIRNLALGLSLGLSSLAVAQRGVAWLNAPDGSPMQALMVDNNGNVGINNISPQARLDVNGNLLLSGTHSTIFTTGDGPVGHRGGLQLVTYAKGGNFLVTPTDQTGKTLDSAVRFGGWGFFNTNTVSLLVSGNVGVKTANAPQAVSFTYYDCFSWLSPFS